MNLCVGALCWPLTFTNFLEQMTQGQDKETESCSQLD